MLIRFAVENYMSFKEQQVFSMAAGKGSRHPSHIISINDNRLLKSSFLFGANAAGKSNFIHAVDFMRRTVVAGSSKAGKTRDRYFRIDPDYSKKPGIFQTELAADGRLYNYGFSIDYLTREFQTEWLYDITKEEEICLFERDVQKREMRTDLHLESNPKDKMRYEVYTADISSDRLFLSEIAKKDIDEESVFQHFKSVYQWFGRVVVVYPNSRPKRMNDFFVNDSGNKTLLAQMLSDFDTGIESISSKKKPLAEALRFMPDDQRNHFIDVLDKAIHDDDELHNSLEKGERKSIQLDNRRFILSMKNGELQAEELMMDHGNKGDLFGLLDESDGTQRLFDLVPAYEVVKGGRVILIDEVDRSFHSKLTEMYVRRYFELTKGKACQMICTTHDLNLMTLSLLRQDEIWFVERNVDHSTHLYSLSEYKTRSDKSVLNDYVQGRYGAIPCISETIGEEE